MQWLSRLLGLHQNNDKILEELKLIQEKLNRIESLEHGGRAAYVGNGRVLTKAVFPKWSLSYFAEGNDRLISPHLITHGRHEEDLTNYFINTIKSNDNCLDLGANIGYFTCLMGKLASEGKTIALEADPLIFEYTRDNIYINFLEGRTTAICGAIADHNGDLTLHRRVTRSGNTSIINTSTEYTSSLGEPASEKFTVQCFTIDSLLEQMGGRIDHIKIDVEGAEPLAFKGIRQTIRLNPQLAVIMEWSPAQIHAAGFDLCNFISDLKDLHLKPSVLTIEGHPNAISYDDLLATNYISGLLLRV